jgi:putative glutamine amidotransferase
MEAAYLHEAVSMNKPALGICRGIQLINAALGGKLYQDLPTQHPSDVEHHQSPPYDIPVHDVAIVKDSPLYQCLKTGRLFVNSYHHQAVKTLAESLKVMAEAPDGTIEAVYMPGHCFLWAVQWHPEFSWRTDEHSRKIFKDFIKHCF